MAMKEAIKEGMMSERIARLRKRFSDTVPEICPERARYFTESMKRTEGEPIVLRRAKAFYEVLDKMTVFVADDELIIGNQASKPRAVPVYPEYSYEWLIEEFNGKPYHFYERPADKFYYTEAVKNEIFEIIDYWKGKTLFENLRRYLPEEYRNAWDAGVTDTTWVSICGFGNIIPDYKWVLEEGLNGVIRKAKEELEKLNLAEPGAVKKKWFLEAVIIGNEAVINFANRLSEHCLELAESEDNPARKKELLEMARISRKVPAEGATTFWEALQSVWMILLTVHLESNGHAISLGRFDQYLYPYYRSDIDTGRLTEAEALELIEAFYIKTNELNKIRSWADTSVFTGYHMAINLTIGGLTPEGKDATNELTHLSLEACRELRLPTPSVSLQVSKVTTDELLDKALQVIQEHGGGQPALYNAEAFIEALKVLGIREEDLYNYAQDGCIEATIPGKWDFAAKGAWLNVAKILELTLYGGKDPLTGKQLYKTEGTLETFGSMEELMDSFRKQLHHYIEMSVALDHMNDEFHRMMDLNAFRSSLIHDSIERGLDLIEGGSIYSADGAPVVGVMTAADGLAAIEQLVFKEKRITGKQLLHALKTNFHDDSTDPTGDEIRQLLLRAPKFGNDDDRADKYAVEITDTIGYNYRYKFKNSRYGKGPVPGSYALSLSSVTGNAAYGRFVGATPDGRYAGKPVNNGISPSNGAEKEGPTGVINSVGKLPSKWFQKGAILNLRLASGVLKTEEGRKRAMGLVRTLFDKMGVHIQFNVVDTEVLLDAMKHPDEYQDLLVRVAGYSAYFVPLDEDLKWDIVTRSLFDL